jgi:SWI/SNF-related matrix-associated actin-dependent regulator of chromatin subfamily A-like protein 1
MSIMRQGNIHLITFRHPDKDGFMQLVDAVKSVGATWSSKDKAWVLVEQAKVDVLKHALMTSTTPQQLLSVLQGTRSQYLDLPPMEYQYFDPEWEELKPHQHAAIPFVNARDGILLAWGMRTRKTATTALCLNAAQRKHLPALIICPAGLKRHWYGELKGDKALDKPGWLLDKSITVGIASGNYFPDTDIVIINYDIVDRHKAKLDSIRWAFIGLDEPHGHIGNEKAKRTIAICGGTKGRGKDKQQWSPLRAKRRLCLTGTPISSKLQNIWPMLNWLDPKNWPSKYWFENKYCTVTEREQWVKKFNPKTKKVEPVCIKVREVGPPTKEQAEALNKRLLATVMFRIRTRDVLDLPPVVRRVIEVDIDDPALKAENKFLDTQLADASSLKAAIRLAELLGDEKEYIRAITRMANFVRKTEEHLSVLRQKIAIAKVPFVVEHVRSILEDETDQKVIVWAHHHAVIQALENALREVVPGGVVTYYGDTNEDNRALAEKRIQTDPTCRVFIGGMTSAGEGLKLSGATWEVFAEESSIPRHVQQCEARPWDEKHEQSYMVDHIVAYASYDSIVAKRMVQRLEMIDAALDSGLSLDQPVDWLEDHREDSAIEVPTEREPRKRIPKPLRPIEQIVQDHEELKVSLVDLIVATRLADLKEPGPKAQEYINMLVSRYLPVDSTPSA